MTIGVLYKPNLFTIIFGNNRYEYNNFDEIPNYDNIIYLDCSYNKLTELPELPKSLKKLRCKYNKLTSLPKLPNSLKLLSCENNQLTSLPELPNSLIKLVCWNNQLTSLPELPNSLQHLSCDNNKFIKKVKYKYLKLFLYF